MFATTTKIKPATFPANVNALFLCASLAIGLYSPESSAYVYTCERADTACVVNYNKNAIAENAGVKTYNLVRVAMDGGDTKDMNNIKSSARWLEDFFMTASRGQLNVRLNEARTVELAAMSCKEAKSALPEFANDLFTIRVFPWVMKPVRVNHQIEMQRKPLCGSSNAGNGKANLVGTLKRDFAHEVGHLLGLKHGHSRNPNTGEFKEYGDGTTIMGVSGAYNYSVPQLHWLGWTQKADVVQLDADALNNGGTLEVTLRPVDKNEISNSPTPLAYVHDLSNDRRLFITIPQSDASGHNGNIPAGRIAFYTAPKCKGCKGMAMDDTLIDSIYNPKDSKDYQVEGLIVNPVRVESRQVRQDGHLEERITSVTLHIRKAP